MNRYAWSLLATVAVLGCRSEAIPTIKLRLMGPPLVDLQFRPQTALAEYIELPDDHNELRITLASYKTTCTEFIPPPPDGALLTVVIALPPDTTLEPRAYPYLTGADAPSGPSAPGPEPRSVPILRTYGEDHEIPPGGSVQLTRIELERGATIAGVLDYEFAGDQDRGATSIAGQFSAEICRVSRAHLRPTQ